jgi:hypothetical protein
LIQLPHFLIDSGGQAADVYTASTAFLLLESIRLDLGAGSQIHP